MDIEFTPDDGERTHDVSLLLQLHQGLDYQGYIIEKMLELQERYPEAYEYKKAFAKTIERCFKQIEHLQTTIKAITDAEEDTE